jgi:hypothetical protein
MGPAGALNAAFSGSKSGKLGFWPVSLLPVSARVSLHWPDAGSHSHGAVFHEPPSHDHSTNR